MRSDFPPSPFPFPSSLLTLPILILLILVVVQLYSLWVWAALGLAWCFPLQMNIFVVISRGSIENMPCSPPSSYHPPSSPSSAPPSTRQAREQEGGGNVRRIRQLTGGESPSGQPPRPAPSPPQWSGSRGQPAGGSVDPLPPLLFPSPTFGNFGASTSEIRGTADKWFPPSLSFRPPAHPRVTSSSLPLLPTVVDSCILHQQSLPLPFPHCFVLTIWTLGKPQTTRVEVYGVSVGGATAPSPYAYFEGLRAPKYTRSSKSARNGPVRPLSPCDKVEEERRGETSESSDTTRENSSDNLRPYKEWDPLLNCGWAARLGEFKHARFGASSGSDALARTRLSPHCQPIGARYCIIRPLLILNLMPLNPSRERGSVTLTRAQTRDTADGDKAGCDGKWLSTESGEVPAKEGVRGVTLSVENPCLSYSQSVLCGARIGCMVLDEFDRRSEQASTPLTRTITKRATKNPGRRDQFLGPARTKSESGNHRHTDKHTEIISRRAHTLAMRLSELRQDCITTFELAPNLGALLLLPTSYIHAYMQSSSNNEEEEEEDEKEKDGKEKDEEEEKSL
ncbi:hypothetical protein O3P69_000211 [Scylla paramamosain]|uniref:Uncharacterized protein n=1 Tax=Scylla paramamosain TaxID=85552 RepID=A0AAW0UWS6_SCYPA